MKFTKSTSLLTLPLLGQAVLGAHIAIKTPQGDVKPDSYVVVLKSGIDKAEHISTLSQVNAFNTGSEITHHRRQYFAVLNGYAAILKGDALTHVLTSSEVEYVEADAIARINWHEKLKPYPAEETDAKQDDHQVETRASGGAGSKFISSDTGIYTAHSCFGGRASWGATFGGYANADGNGHGTHTAGTAVGTSFGIATQAHIVAVKVLSDSGSGAYSDVIAGVNWAYSQFQSNHVPSIATMSLGGPQSSALDSAVNAVSRIQSYALFGRNSNVNAATTSPADVAAANTIGAVDNNKVKASFSNWGAILDVWAPGVNILSAWIGNPSATNILSGTSMATPYVAGILAVALGEYGQVSPATLTNNLKSHAQAVVTGQPSGTTNLFATLW
ncbi:putative subtilisin-like serine protease [Clavulina sp. PMI_390]|nr:putative subtilisin-like serine protease [Clavulina sp. PMI_390]